MKFKKNLFFILPVSFIFASGLILFLIGSIGTTLGEDAQGVVYNNGYFGMTSASNSMSITQTIDENNKKYEEFKKQFTNANQENSQRTNINEQNKILNYYSGFQINYYLFISGAVLWPVSLTALFVYFIVFAIKNRKKDN